MKLLELMSSQEVFLISWYVLSCCVMDQCNEMDQCDEMEQDAVTTLCFLLLSYVTKFIVQKGRFIFLIL